MKILNAAIEIVKMTLNKDAFGSRIVKFIILLFYFKLLLYVILIELLFDW